MFSYIFLLVPGFYDNDAIRRCTISSTKHKDRFVRIAFVDVYRHVRMIRLAMGKMGFIFLN